MNKTLTICAKTELSFGSDTRSAYRVFHRAMVIRETDKAVLVSPTEGAKKNQQFWIPKSQISQHGTRIKIPSWLWDKTVGHSLSFDWVGAKVIMENNSASRFYAF